MEYLLIIFLLGVMTPIQTASNSRLRLSVGTPLVASLVSFSVSTLFLAAITIAERGGFLFPGSVVSELPWWSWLGGIIGGTFVTGFAYFAGKVGVGVLLVTSICGMLTVSLFIDKFGWLGANKRKIGLLQYAGVLLIAAGVALLRLN